MRHAWRGLLASQYPSTSGEPAGWRAVVARQKPEEGFTISDPVCPAAPGMGRHRCAVPVRHAATLTGSPGVAGWAASRQRCSAAIEPPGASCHAWLAIATHRPRLTLAGPAALAR